jgi:hypothetical protein
LPDPPGFKQASECARGFAYCVKQFQLFLKVQIVVLFGGSLANKVTKDGNFAVEPIRRDQR